MPSWPHADPHLRCVSVRPRGQAGAARPADGPVPPAGERARRRAGRPPRRWGSCRRGWSPRRVSSRSTWAGTSCRCGRRSSNHWLTMSAPTSSSAYGRRTCSTPKPAASRSSEVVHVARVTCGDECSESVPVPPRAVPLLSTDAVTLLAGATLDTACADAEASQLVWSGGLSRGVRYRGQVGVRVSQPNAGVRRQNSTRKRGVKGIALGLIPAMRSLGSCEAGPGR